MKQKHHETAEAEMETAATENAATVRVTVTAKAKAEAAAAEGKRKRAPFTASYDAEARTVTLTIGDEVYTMFNDYMDPHTAACALGFGVVNAINNAGSVPADKLTGIVDQAERVRRAKAVFDRLANGGPWTAERTTAERGLGMDGTLIVRALELSGRSRAEVAVKIAALDARTKAAIVAATDTDLAPYIAKAREELTATVDVGLALAGI